MTSLSKTIIDLLIMISGSIGIVVVLTLVMYLIHRCVRLSNIVTFHQNIGLVHSVSLDAVPVTEKGQSDVVRRTIDLSGIRKEFHENYKRMINCPQHLFLGPLEKPLGSKRFKCEICETKIPTIDIFQYCQGFRAAGKDPSVICPDVKPSFFHPTLRV